MTIYRYRCTKTLEGEKRHYTRVSLPKPIEEYERPPKCYHPGCGAVYEVRDESRTAYHQSQLCRCDGMPDNRPHRKGTRMNVEGEGLFFCNDRELTEEEEQELYESRGGY